MENAKIERREIRHADYDIPAVGHMGFFRTRCAEKYGLKSVAGWRDSVNPRDNVFPAIFLIVEEINRTWYAVTVGAQVSKRQQAHPGK